MTIISNKSLKLIKGDEKMLIRNKVQTVCPEWVKDDPLFQLAVKAGDITFVNTPVLNPAEIPAESKSKKKASEVTEPAAN